MYLCTRRKIWTSFSRLVLLKCYHVVFSQFKIPANLAQLAVSKMHCLYANAVVQPSVQHCPCYMAWETKVHTWCRHCHLCINVPMWREKRWLQGIIDPPSYIKRVGPIRLYVCIMCRPYSFVTLPLYLKVMQWCCNRQLYFMVRNNYIKRK